MQYVRSMSGAVSKTWNSINPATLSGAIDVIVVEQEDGSLACSPFHIRFGKFSLLRPSEKKVEFKVNGEKVDFPMKLGEGGEAFFVFETRDQVPESLQTSPLVSPVASPELAPSQTAAPALQEPEPFDLENLGDVRIGSSEQHGEQRGSPPPIRKVHSDYGRPTAEPQSSDESVDILQTPKIERVATESDLTAMKAGVEKSRDHSIPLDKERPVSAGRTHTTWSTSSSPTAPEDAVTRAMNLSKKLWTSNISNQVTDSGDLMLDMTGFKSSEGEALQAEVIARQLLSEEIDGPYDIGALIGADEHGNIWIYSSEEAKAAAGKKAAQGLGSYNPAGFASAEALSDPGYHSDDSRSDSNIMLADQLRRDSDSAVGMVSQPSSPDARTRSTHGDPNKNYAKTLRLTSDQLKAMSLKSGANSMAFTVNRATCAATLWYWRHDNPIVISDIDGTITKSDVLGHVLNSLGRDWTHLGVAKLYTEISANGYNFLYLTSRSVGQADTTRAYLDGVVQEGYRLPKGPVILSPDRTIAALRREIYLRKPEIFKMACLRDIMALFSGHGGSNNTHESAEAGLHVEIPGENGLGTSKGKSGSPFYAGFGNRLTDALSYRSVNIPSTRIFTINSNSEVSLDLLSLNKYKTAYSSMREIVDHYFPPTGLLVKGGGEEFTDFNYWREQPLDLVDFTDSDSETEDFAIEKAVERAQLTNARASMLSEDEAGDDMLDSFISDGRPSLDESLANSLELSRTSEETTRIDDDDELGYNDTDDGASDDEADSGGDNEYLDDDNESVSTADFQTPAVERSAMFAGDAERTPRVRAVQQNSTKVNDLFLTPSK